MTPSSARISFMIRTLSFTRWTGARPGLETINAAAGKLGEALGDRRIRSGKPLIDTRLEKRLSIKLHIVIMSVGAQSLVVNWINLTLFKFSFTLSAF